LVLCGVIEIAFDTEHLEAAEGQLGKARPASYQKLFLRAARQC
jgi:hypothetical protein